MEEIITCPVCGLELFRKEGRFVCGNNHSFDLAKEGYLNLLLVSRKGSNIPGDSLEMVQSRRAFLETGVYEPLLAEIIEVSSTNIKNDSVILDCGSGEGYYLGNVLSSLLEKGVTAFGVGIDLSKDGVKLAAKKYRDAFFIVSNLNYDLPIQSQSVDLLFNIFAPRNVSEYSRVLKNDGVLVVVTPGAGHLAELREVLGAKVGYEEKGNVVSEQLGEVFKKIESRQVRFRRILSKNELENLVKMTPLYYQIDQNKLLELGEIDCSFDFEIAVFRKALS